MASRTRQWIRVSAARVEGTSLSVTVWPAEAAALWARSWQRLALSPREHVRTLSDPATRKVTSQLWRGPALVSG